MKTRVTKNSRMWCRGKLTKELAVDPFVRIGWHIDDHCVVVLVGFIDKVPHGAASITEDGVLVEHLAQPVVEA